MRNGTLTRCLHTVCKQAQCPDQSHADKSARKHCVA